MRLCCGNLYLIGKLLECILVPIRLLYVVNPANNTSKKKKATKKDTKKKDGNKSKTEKKKSDKSKGLEKGMKESK